MAPRAPTKESSHMTSQPASTATEYGKDARAPLDRDSPGMNLTLFHKARLCAGLLASEAVGVFSYLFVLPVSQTLGTPVSLLTVPGVVSASLGLALVPLLGCLLDGGPRRRQKHVLLSSFLVLAAGLGLVLSGVVLKVMDDAAAAASPRRVSPVVNGLPAVAGIGIGKATLGGADSTTWSGTDNTTWGGADDSSWEGVDNSTWGGVERAILSGSDSDEPPGHNNAFQTTASVAVSPANLHGSVSEDVGHDTPDADSISIDPAESPQATLIGFPKQTTSSRTDYVTSTPSPNHQNDPFQIPEFTEPPVLLDETDEAAPTHTTLLGFPLAALLGMAGFVCMDVGFDVSNAAVKTFMLSNSDVSDHVSLLVTGVFMSALGGVVASVTGLLDLGHLLPQVDPVCGQAMLQLSSLLVVSALACACSLLSAPSLTTTSSSLSSSPSSASCPKDTTDVEWRGEGHDDDDDDDDDDYDDGDCDAEMTLTTTEATMTLQTEVQENMILATTSAVDALMSTSCQVERTLGGLSVSFAWSQRSAAHREAADSTESSHLLPPHPYKNPPTTSPHYSAIREEETGVGPGSGSAGAGQFLRRTRVKLCLIWVAAFFVACCIFTYNVTVADYLGKVVFRGDPEAEVGSAAHALYEEGLRSGSLCTLLLNVTYVLFSLCHNRVLAVISLKTEFVLVTTAMTAMMLGMYLTGSIVIIYVTSCLMGLCRAALYTVPFMLANDLCQKQAQVSAARGEGQTARIGSTIALVTCALPSAYLLVSSLVGPLIAVTGDPSAPLLVSVVSALLAALSLSLYRT